jgi:hypothetical protein
MAFLPRKIVLTRTDKPRSLVVLSLSIFASIIPTNFVSGQAQEQTVSEQDYEREELGVNRYTAPSITEIFYQLDQLGPLPFDQLCRDYPQTAHGSREQMALVFGTLIADGFLLVACAKKDLVEEFGRNLLRQAQSLSVADCVTRHSKSLTELAKSGDWPAVRKELIATQSDVEQAMRELRDQKIAHLISLGGWLRGLEICAGAVEIDFSPERARALSQPELLNYFSDELKTMPPAVAYMPLFQKLRTGLSSIRAIIDSQPKLTDVQKIRETVGALNQAIATSR